jgi:hypothetical protein
MKVKQTLMTNMTSAVTTMGGKINQMVNEIE